MDFKFTGMDGDGDKLSSPHSSLKQSAYLCYCTDSKSACSLTKADQRSLDFAVIGLRFIETILHFEHDNN